MNEKAIISALEKMTAELNAIAGDFRAVVVKLDAINDEIEKLDITERGALRVKVDQ